MRRFSIGALAALVLATAAQAAPAPIRYTLSPVIEQGALKALAVDIDFTAEPSGVTRLRFKDSFEGVARPGRYAEGLAVTGADKVTPLKDDQTEIRSAPSAALHAHYLVRSGFDAPPTTQDGEQTRPIILPAWFYSAGELIFAFPAGRFDAPATFAWTGAPAGFGFASDLERLAARPGTVTDILFSIVMGSPHLRTISGTGPDAGLRIATVGRFDQFDDAAFGDAVFRIVRGERAFWADPDGEPFLVTLAPLVSKVVTHYSGTGRGDAFALWVGDAMSLKEILPLLAHEHFHTWNPMQLGGMGQDRSASWLSEGFTDFYTRRMLLRTGLFDLQDYVAAWNEWLLAYGVSPARNATEAQIVKDYWTDHDAEDVAYKRGMMMAALFDAELRKAGRHDLDDVMREMRDLRRRDPERLLRPNFEKAFQGVAGRSALPEIDRYEMRGETLVLPADAFACLKLDTVTQPAFALGFDPEATAKTAVFAGVDPAGPAYAAGLRDGMKRLSREGGSPNDSSVEIAYHVADADGRERVIRYRPVGKTMVSFQKLSVPEELTLEREQACIRTLSGRGAGG